MVHRTTICSAVLVMGVVLNLSVAAAAACQGDACSANGKPLDIMQFMSEQAASTRVAKPRPSPPPATAKAHRAPHRAIAAQRKPVPMPIEAAASFASRPEQYPQPTTIGQDTPITRAADAAPVETTGMGIISGPVVQFVDAEELNDIDRKAENSPQLSINAAGGDHDQARSEPANTSWLRWIWSALGSTFAALATAMHQLIRV